MDVVFLQRLAVLISVAVFPAGCAVERALPMPETYLARYGIEAPTDRRFVYCSGHGCRTRTGLALSDTEWAKITAPFDHPAQTAAEERSKIADAVAAQEKIAGRYSGSYKDRGRTSMSDEGQLDCIDETVNSLSLLMLLKYEGLLQWHRPSNPAGRGEGLDWPHYTATITEIPGGAVYSVDSWFFDNGKPAVVMGIKNWKAG